MHASVLAWLPSRLSAQDVAGKTVVEVGAYDVNGSVRPAIEALGPASYIGVDQGAGPRVDVVADVSALPGLFGEESTDIVISTEMLEHARDWRGALVAMTSILKPGGRLLLTTRGPGFPFHPFPEDHWRFTPELIFEALTRLGFAGKVMPDTDPQSPGVFADVILEDPLWDHAASLHGLDALPVA